MRNKLVLLSLVMVLCAAVVFFTMPGCKGGECGNMKKSAVKNSYKEVTGKLDQGGHLFGYASTERVIKTMDEFIVKLRQLVEKETAKEEDKEALKTFDFIHGMIKKSGIMEISGVGFSSISLEEKLNHNKMVIHHYKGKGTGLVWNLMEPAPHDLPILKMLPKNTVVATYGDFKLINLWEWVKKETETSGLKELQQGILMAEPAIGMLGIQVDKLKASIGNGMGFVLAVDPDKKAVFPTDDKTIEFPEPSLAIFIDVNDDFIFELLAKKIPNVQKTEENGIKKITIPIPQMPFKLQPTIVQKDKLLIIATSGDFVNAMLDAEKNGNGLIATDQFKKLSTDIPSKGNSFRYVGSNFSTLLFDLQQKILKASGELDDDKQQLVKQFLDMLPKDLAQYGVLQNTDEGMVYTFNSRMDLEGLVLLPATITAGVVAAIAVPNLLTATQKGKMKATMGDMKTISIAIQSYVVDNETAPAGKQLKDLESKLMPFYIKKLPLKDGWGNDFLYIHGIGGNKTRFAIASPGKDGVFQGWNQSGTYVVKDISGFENDIIMVDGNWVYGPKLK